MKHFIPDNCPGLQIRATTPSFLQVKVTDLSLAQKHCKELRAFAPINGIFEFTVQEYPRAASVLLRALDLNKVAPGTLIGCKDLHVPSYSISPDGLVSKYSFRSTDPTIHEQQLAATGVPGTLDYRRGCWWSDQPAVRAVDAATKYNIPAGAESWIIFASTGVQYDYFVSDLLPLKDGTPTHLSNLHTYKSQDVDTLILWNKTGKIYSVLNITQDNALLYKVLATLSTSVRPQLLGLQAAEVGRHSTIYTNMTLEEHYALPEFWERLMNLQPEMCSVLVALAKQNNLDALATAAATKLLTLRA